MGRLRSSHAGLALALGLAAPAWAFTGPTLVADGDTLMVGAQRVRLWGIDAPEGDQVCQDAQGHDFGCGDVSREQLRRLVAGQAIQCEARDRDPYGRTVALCRVAGRDLGQALVLEGWAIDYASFSGGAYAEAEQTARQARRGLWAGRFQPPAAWRAAERAAPARPLVRAETGGPPGCRIKGNINGAGARIFHLPGQRDYEATHINPGRGERWFCSAAEAEAAGWRAARR